MVFKKLKMFLRLDSMPLQDIYAKMPRMALFYLLFAAYDIYLYTLGRSAALISGMCNLLLGSDLCLLGYRGPGVTGNKYLLYVGSLSATVGLALTIIDIISMGFSGTSLLYGLLVLMLSGPIIFILSSIAGREGRGDTEVGYPASVSAGLAEPIVTAHASYA